MVADEIRKLATDSTASIKKIEAVIRTVQKDADDTFIQMGQLGRAIEQVAEAIVHVASTIQEASAMAQKLDCIAEDLARGEG